MDKWTAVKKSDLLLELYLIEQNLNFEDLEFWNSINIKPEIWSCSDVIEANFWVVAKSTNHIIWYNDIEEGFIISDFKNEGEILNYTAKKQELEVTIQQLKLKLNA